MGSWLPSERQNRCRSCRYKTLTSGACRAVVSSEAVSTDVPSDEKAATLTLCSCPESVLKHTPFLVPQIFALVLQIFAVVSSDAVSTNFPSGENTAAFT